VRGKWEGERPRKGIWKIRKGRNKEKVTEKVIEKVIVS